MDKKALQVAQKKAKANGDLPASGTLYKDQGLEVSAGGMTKREEFVRAALQGYAGDYGRNTGRMTEGSLNHIADMAVKLADKVLLRMEIEEDLFK